VEPKGVVYNVACCTVGCDWQQDCATSVAACLAGRGHEETYEFHVTVVFSPDESSMAA